VYSKSTIPRKRFVTAYASRLSSSSDSAPRLPFLKDWQCFKSRSRWSAPDRSPRYSQLRRQSIKPIASIFSNGSRALVQLFCASRTGFACGPSEIVGPYAKMTLPRFGDQVCHCVSATPVDNILWNLRSQTVMRGQRSLRRPSEMACPSSAVCLRSMHRCAVRHQMSRECMI
jgi:hypothetical protein